MLSLHFYRIIPEREEQLRAWLAELDARGEEVRRVFVEEGIRRERAFVVSTPEGPVLVAMAELEGRELGAELGVRSLDGLDLEHRTVLNACLAERLDSATVLAALNEPLGSSG